MIAIVDYDTGNTRNVQKALNYIGLDNLITADHDTILNANGVILPGVGAFPLAMEALKSRNLIATLKEVAANGTPLLGICLGMQLLFDGSFEHRYTPGLGLLPGVCQKLPDDKTFPVPHMGWNELVVTSESSLTNGVNGDYVYYVHSYYADCDPTVIDAFSQYSIKVPGLVSNGNIFGAQFHPEKSGNVGLSILKSFREVVES